MSDRLILELECGDHGEVGRHYYQTPATYPSGEYKYEWCDGGERQEVVVDYAAAYDLLADTLDNLGFEIPTFGDAQWEAIVDAALGLEE